MIERLKSFFAKEAPKSAPLLGEIGASGTNIFNGYIAEEYNSKLASAKDRLDVYKKMVRGDGTCRGLSRAVKMPIVQADYFFESAGQDRVSIEQKEFCDYVFFEKINFIEFMSSVVLSIDYGCMFNEMVEELEGGMVVYSRLAPRLPKSIEKFLPEKGGRETGIQQLVYKDGKFVSVDIPVGKLIRFSIDQEGDDYWGQSIFRAAYKHWLFLETTYKVQGIATERNGLGIPTLTPTGDGIMDQASIDQSKDVLSSLRAGCNSHMIVPSGAELKLTSVTHQYDFAPQIEHHSRQILQSALFQFINIGSGSNSGGFSQSESEKELAYRVSMGYATYFVSRIQEALVKRIIDLNFPGVTEYPKLKIAGIKEENLQELTSAIKSSSDSGLISPTIETENNLRTRLGLPEIEKEDFVGEKKEEIKKDDDVKKKVNNSGCAHGHIKLQEDTVKKVNINGVEIPLTKAEERMNLKKMIKFMDDKEAEIERIVKKKTKNAIEQLTDESPDVADNKRTFVYSDEVKSDISELKKELPQIGMESYEFGKTEAVNEMGRSDRIATPKERRNTTSVEAKTFVDDLFDGLKTTGVLVAADSLSKGVSTGVMKKAIKDSLVEKRDIKGRTFGGINTTAQINRSRTDIQTEFSDDIWGWQYVAILDGRTTNLCLSLDARVGRRMSDIPEPPLHPHCRSMRVAILNEQSEKPQVNKPPKRVVEGINPDIFKTQQPTKPFVVNEARAKNVDN